MLIKNMNILEEILEKIGEIENLIVYSSPQQIDNVMQIINKRRIPRTLFYMAEGTKQEKNIKDILRESTC